MWRRCADSMGLHRVENASHTSPAVSLHLYSPPFQSCRSFDLRTGMARTVRTTFWSKNGRRTSPADISGTGAQQRREQVSYRPLIILCCYQFLANRLSIYRRLAIWHEDDVCNVPVLPQNDSTYHHSVFTTWKWHPFATWTPSFIILVWEHHPLIGAKVFACLQNSRYY